MGMRYEDFWYNYNLREFWNAVEGYLEKVENNYKLSWEQTRTIAYFIERQPVYMVKKRHQTPNKLMPFPWDNEGKEIDEEDVEDVRQRLKELNNG